MPDEAKGQELENNRREILQKIGEWNRKYALALDELTMIQVLCHHPKTQYLGRAISNIWEKCLDCELLIVKEELPDVFDLT